MMRAGNVRMLGSGIARHNGRRASLTERHCRIVIRIANARYSA
jgi:hypothetical protein